MKISPSDEEEFLRKSFKLWLLARWTISTGEHKGNPYRFGYAPFMAPLCDDDFRDICVMKCAQSTFSEQFVARMLFRALTQKKNFLYTFPAGAQLRDFVETRIRSPIVDSPYLKRFIGDTCNLGLITFGGNELHFRGVTQRRQIISVPVSEIYCDEIDEYPDPDRTIYTIKKRMGMARSPCQYLFSTPKLPGIGISKYYYGDEDEPGSDQREWIVECGDCHLAQMLEFGRNVIDRNAEKFGTREYYPDCYVGCRKCGTPLDVATGRWVAQNKHLSGYRHGYHVSRLMMPHANIDQLMVDSRDPMKIQEFYNSELGLPRRPYGESITEGLLKDLLSDYVMYDGYNFGSFMGVDQGAKFNVVIISPDLKVLHAREYDYTEDWSEISRLIVRFRVLSVICDANPNIERSRKFADLHRGLVKLSIYPSMTDTMRGREVFSYNPKDTRMIRIDRERAMEYVTDILLTRQIQFPSDMLIRVPHFFDHLRAPIRAKIQDSTGNEVVKYLKPAKPDHYFHALLYALIALKRKSGYIGVITNIFSRKPMRYAHTS